ncbi:MAG: glycine/betaine ABC transporter permease, partial [Brevibacterium aurantiacum]
MTMLDNHVPEPEPDPGSEADSEPDPAASTTDAEQAVSQDTGSARRSNIGSVFYWSVAFVIAFVLWA